MNDTYAIYLASEAWNEKRIQKLRKCGFRCEACGSRERLQVHHLTYERIFREDAKDLIVFCQLHHQAAEEMIRKGAIPRTGCAAKLRELTLRFIQPRESNKPRHQKIKKNGIKQPARELQISAHEIRALIMKDQEVVALLSAAIRKHFKKAVRRKYRGRTDISLNRLVMNALYLFDHPHARVSALQS